MSCLLGVNHEQPVVEIRRMKSRSPRLDPVADRQYVSPPFGSCDNELPVEEAPPPPVFPSALSGVPVTDWDTLQTEAGAEGFSD